MEETNSTNNTTPSNTSKESALEKEAGTKTGSDTAKVAKKEIKVIPPNRPLSPPHGSRKRKQILGRGDGSGRGGTSTRGHKGHRARSGFKALPFFEGGQMPLARRLPKVGFTNSPFKKEFKVVSLKDIEGRLETGVEITCLLLKQKRLVKGKKPLVKLTNKHNLTKLSKTFKINLKEVQLTLAARKVLETSGSQIVE